MGESSALCAQVCVKKCLLPSSIVSSAAIPHPQLNDYSSVRICLLDAEGWIVVFLTRILNLQDL